MGNDAILELAVRVFSLPDMDKKKKTLGSFSYLLSVVCSDPQFTWATLLDHCDLARNLLVILAIAAMIVHTLNRLLLERSGWAVVSEIYFGVQ